MEKTTQFIREIKDNSAAGDNETFLKKVSEIINLSFRDNSFVSNSELGHLIIENGIVELLLSKVFFIIIINSILILICIYSTFSFFYLIRTLYTSLKLIF